MWRFSPWSYSNSGKSVTHTKLKPSSLINSRRFASSRRTLPRTVLATITVSAPKRSRSPSSASKALFIEDFSSSVRNLAIGDCQPSAVIFTHARPFAPYVEASSVRPSISLRENVAHPLALMAFTSPPASTAPEKTLKPHPLRRSVRSVNSRPNLVSGVSRPKRSMASLYVIRLKAPPSATSTESASLNRCTMRPSIISITSSESTKLISASI